MTFIKVFVAVVFQRCQPGLFSFTGEGLEELGDGIEFILFVEIDAFNFGRLGEEIKEDEDLFFGEDPFFFSEGIF